MHRKETPVRSSFEKYIQHLFSKERALQNHAMESHPKLKWVYMMLSSLAVCLKMSTGSRRKTMTIIPGNGLRFFRTMEQQSDRGIIEEMV